MSHPTLIATLATTLTLIGHLPLAKAIIIEVPGDYPTIQEAIDAAEDGDTILVANGTHTGDGNYNLDFRGRDLTVRSQGGPESCTLDANGLGRLFLFQNGETENSVIAGFALRNGNAWAAGTESADGGAISCDNGSSPTIRNCHFVQNRADAGGAVFGTSESHPKIEDCKFGGNRAIAGGALAAVNFSSPHLIRCQFVGNSAAWGGAVAGWFGWYENFEEPVIEDCIFSSNKAADMQGYDAAGGAIFFFRTYPYFSRCTFRGNEAEGAGGAIHNQKSNPFLMSCLFDGNRAQWAGAIYNNIYSIPDIVNCTIVNNESELEAGGVWVTHGSSTLVNCVLWGNRSETGGGNQVWDNGHQVYIFNSVVEGGWEDGWEIHDVDPEFLNPHIGDYRVTRNSPCVDLGFMYYVPEGETEDLNHDPRVVWRTIDAGAFEVQVPFRPTTSTGRK